VIAREIDIQAAQHLIRRGAECRAVEPRGEHAERDR
jgi:hypothetical protein